MAAHASERPIVIEEGYDGVQEAFAAPTATGEIEVVSADLALASGLSAAQRMQQLVRQQPRMIIRSEVNPSILV